MKWLLISIIKESNPYIISFISQSFRYMIQSNKKLVWFPSIDINLDGSRHSSSVLYYPGKMVSLKEIVYEDRSKLFHFNDTPIYDMSRYYNSDNNMKEILYCFCRVTYCNFCKATEGLFGASGNYKHLHLYVYYYLLYDET